MRPDVTLACLTSLTSAVKLLLPFGMLFGLTERDESWRPDCKKPRALAKLAKKRRLLMQGG